MWMSARRDDDDAAPMPNRLDIETGAAVELTRASKCQEQCAAMRHSGIRYQRVMKKHRFACGSAARAHHIFLARNSF
jgi:hypothetical protein